VSSELVYHDAELDLRGMLCPLPVLRARKRLAAMNPGEILKILATDPLAAIDFPHYCAESGHALLATDRLGDVMIFFIRKTHAS
jgi:tRNA 2-thiouridine synthesizing protein A